jgi:osmoprotectant transport system substrate-binding protein
VGSFDFPESELLASIYAQALRARGIDARVLPSVGSRELLEPALARGLVDILPEYAGSALGFLTRGRVQPASLAATHRALASALRRHGLDALAPARAEDVNTIVVTRETARRFGLRTVSDLAPVAGRLSFGGPPECRTRPLCLAGLERVYGLRFGRFIELDTGGPLTLQALRAGQLDVGLLFSTDPGIPANRLVPLRDDRNLQPPENVTPVLRTATLSALGTRGRSAIDDVSARLTTRMLRGLNARLLEGATPSDVAARWLAEQGLA